MNKLKEKIKNLNKSQKIALIIVFLLILLLIVSGITYAVLINSQTAETIAEEVAEKEIIQPELSVTYSLDETETIVTVTIISTEQISLIELKSLSIDEEVETEENSEVEIISQTEDETENTETEYVYDIDEAWTVSEDGLIVTKDYTSNAEETYRVTFENEEFEIQELEIEVTSFEEVTLQVDTQGLAEGTEVTVLTYEDGSIEVITADDPDYDTKVSQATSVSNGTITSSGVTTTTANSTVKSTASSSAEEQASNVTVTNSSVSSTDNTTTAEENDSTSSEDSTSSSSSSTSSTSSSSSNTSTSSSASGSSSSSSSSGSSSTTLSSLGVSSSSSITVYNESNTTGSPIVAYTQRNSTKEANIVSIINTALQSNEYYYLFGGNARSASTSSEIALCLSTSYWSYNTTNLNKLSSSGRLSATTLVYVEDIYYWDSGGNFTYLCDCACYDYVQGY